jgi:hypothetical protein
MRSNRVSTRALKFEKALKSFLEPSFLGAWRRPPNFCWGRWSLLLEHGSTARSLHCFPIANTPLPRHFLYFPIVGGPPPLAARGAHVYLLVAPCSPHAVDCFVTAGLRPPRPAPWSWRALLPVHGCLCDEEPCALLPWVPRVNALLLSVATYYEPARLRPWLGMAPLRLQEMHGRVSRWEEGKKEDDKQVPHVIVY